MTVQEASSKRSDSPPKSSIKLRIYENTANWAISLPDKRRETFLKFVRLTALRRSIPLATSPALRVPSAAKGGQRHLEGLPGKACRERPLLSVLTFARMLGACDPIDRSHKEPSRLPQIYISAAVEHVYV